jgi:hypothetical protein
MKANKAKDKSPEKSEAVSMRIQPKIADDWELEDAVRTLAKAEEIKADDKMMGKIRPMLDKKVRSIEALKELYNSKYNKPSEAMDEDDQEGDED